MPVSRLSKTIKDLNISLDRAVEFLQSKGVEIEKNPNAKLDEKSQNFLISEFSEDKKKKVASKDVVINKLAEQQKQEQEQPKKEEVIKAKSREIAKPKSLGKIDLNAASKPAKKEEKEEVSKPEEKIVSKSEEKPAKTEEATPKEGDDKITTKYQKLDGPKIVGEKIDLSQFKPKTPSGDKKKRKRIVKDSKVDVKAVGNTVNKDGNRPQSGGNRDNNRFGNNNRPGGGGGRRFNNNNSAPKPAVELTEEQVKNQIKETLEKLTSKGSKSKGSKIRRDKRQQRKEHEAEQSELAALDNTLIVTEFVTVNELASLMDVAPTEVISACFSLGIMVTMNQRLDADTMSIVAEEFGYKIEFADAEIEEVEVIEDKAEDLLPRAPIVTIMGHVDHGKTSLLDYIRKANVIAGESGGITQHIGAYNVTLENGQKLAFLDTPGHEAFTAMRARGAQVTDIVIIVIAADDDVMPQTKEAISHAQAAGVPMIIAYNKMDKPDANPDKVREQLSQMNILVEEWGGKVQSQEISARTGLNVDELLEKVLLEAEVLDLKANPNKLANGVVIEAALDKGRGYISTVLVQGGTLKVGDYILAGRNHGKVKALLDERGKNIEEALPSTPVTVLGLDGAPTAGDKFKVYEDEREAKQIAHKREQLYREQSIRTQKHITLDEIGRRIALGDFKELNIILKGDVDGSVEALTDSLQKLSNEQIQVNILHKGVGQITESDVLLASASDAVLIGFNVRPNQSAKDLAMKEEIEIRSYSIIYDAISDVKEAMEGLLSPEIKEEVVGNVEIRETFKISKVGTIAGCMVLDGKITRNSSIRLIREGIVIHTGVLESLKRFKDDAKEVAKGYECGLNLKNYNDIKVGDILEVFEEVAVKKKL